jgi:hypothetical protein
MGLTLRKEVDLFVIKTDSDGRDFPEAYEIY